MRSQEKKTSCGAERGKKKGRRSDEGNLRERTREPHREGVVGKKAEKLKEQGLTYT